jgi:hypothetical protein
MNRSRYICQLSDEYTWWYIYQLTDECSTGNRGIYLFPNRLPNFIPTHPLLLHFESTCRSRRHCPPRPIGLHPAARCRHPLCHRPTPCGRPTAGSALLMSSMPCRLHPDSTHGLTHRHQRRHRAGPLAIDAGPPATDIGHCRSPLIAAKVFFSS